MVIRLALPPAAAVQVAARDGAIVSVQGFARGETNLLLERLYIERSLSVNTDEWRRTAPYPGYPLAVVGSPGNTAPPGGPG
jgi:hypothetical protein